MQLYILDTCPVESAEIMIKRLGHKYSFKMLIELNQLICSAGISDIYKKIPQGKNLQEWILENKMWIHFYQNTLISDAINFIKMQEETFEKIIQIKKDLMQSIIDDGDDLKDNDSYAYFRYAKEYECEIKNNSILPIDDCIREYNKYLDWKVSR